MGANCERCYYLTMSRKSEEHIIRKHFANWNNINRPLNPWESFFFADRITPAELVHRIQNIPRFQLGQIGWSYSQFLYTYDFHFEVGVYPEQGPGCTTARVKIVCNCDKCPGCGIHVPTDIVTIYPWDKFYAQYGRY